MTVKPETSTRKVICNAVFLRHIQNIFIVYRDYLKGKYPEGCTSSSLHILNPDTKETS
jgi:hypothetical protein